MTMLNHHGGIRRYPGRITGRTIRDEGGEIVDDINVGYPRFCKYAAQGAVIRIDSKASETVYCTDKTPHGGRPTDDDVEIQYAGVGDSCEIDVNGQEIRLIVHTEKILFRLCGQSPPVVPGPDGDGGVIYAPPPDEPMPPGFEVPQ